MFLSFLIHRCAKGALGEGLPQFRGAVFSQGELEDKPSSVNRPQSYRRDFLCSDHWSLLPLRQWEGRTHSGPGPLDTRRQH